MNVATDEMKEKLVDDKATQNSISTRGGNKNHGGTSFNRSRGRGNRGGGRFVICRLCNRPGHTIINCYYRFDKNFQGFYNGNSYFSYMQSRPIVNYA